MLHDLLQAHPPPGDRRDALDHMRLAELRLRGAQPGVRVDQSRRQLGVGDRSATLHLAAYDQVVHPGAGMKAHLLGLGHPALAKQLRGQGLVLAGPGGKRCPLVSTHALGLGVEDQLAIGLQAGLDGHGALGEHAQLLGAEAHHLPRPVALRPPCHSQALGE